MSKRSEIKIALEKFLRAGDVKANAALVRDGRKRPILIPEALVDYGKIGKSGRAFYDLGRRLRVVTEGHGRGDDEVWIIPTEMCQISKDEPAAAAGLVLPFGTIIHDHGLWLRYAPGYREVGVNDRGDILILHDPAPGADPATGPVEGAYNTAVTGWSKRLVTRTSLDEHKADRAEADAWLRALAVVGSKTHKVDFKTAGINGTHIGNDAHLSRSAHLNWFDVRDSEMLRIESLVRLRFRKVRREVPHITVTSLTGLPRDQAAFAGFQKKLKTLKKDPVKLGLPAKLADSRFHDPASKTIVPAVFTYFTPLSKLPADLAVVTVNTDYHGEVKSRGVLSPLTAVMSLIDVLSAHTGVAVLNKAGTATSFTGASLSGKSTAAIFWSEKNEKYRRIELRRRYEMDLRRTPDAGRLGEAGIQKELDRILERVGILCQEDWIEILKEGAGHWVFWPAERVLYARAASLPGLKQVLSENHPLLENAAADFGGSGEPFGLGRVDHESCAERVFYDPEWSHLQYDRSPRMISAHLLLDRAPDPGFLVKRAAAREAIDWLIRGRGPDGRFEPLHNPYPEFAGLLMQMGVVGEKLAAAYEAAQRGDMTLLGGGDGKIGEVIFERLDVQVKLWLDHCREVPTFLVNGSAGLELTQDIIWLLSEYPDLFGGWKQVLREEFQKYMLERYHVSYGPRGDWLHIPAHARRS